MRDRQSIIGFTEAELGLTLALVALALWVTSLPIPPRASVVEISSSADSAYKDSARLFRGALGTIDSLQRLSIKTPHCTERGYPTEYIASIVIRGRNTFEIHGRTTDWNGVLASLSVELNFAHENKCRHSVSVSADPPDLGWDESRPAWISIRSVFNTRI